MKVFVSSLIGGMEKFREAAVDAIEALGHTAITAETFAADPSSPKIACLSGIREANLVVLILGARYGAAQASGLSATHEEYQEAKGTKPVLVFVQSGVERDTDQDEFVGEVEGWEGGHFRAAFSNPDDLRKKVTQAIHHWELSTAVAPADSSEMLGRATLVIKRDADGGYQRSDRLLLKVAVAGGPAQQILRPTEIEDPKLARTILKQALFGDEPIFDTDEGSATEFSGERLVVSQDNGNSISVDESGTVLVCLPGLNDERRYGVVIEEDISEKIRGALRFASWLLEVIDPSQRLSRLALAAHLEGSSYLAWRTMREHERNPNTITFGHSYGSSEREPVHLQPPDRARAALNFEIDRLSEDLIALLRRQHSR